VFCVLSCTRAPRRPGLGLGLFCCLYCVLRPASCLLFPPVHDLLGLDTDQAFVSRGESLLAEALVPLLVEHDHGRNRMGIEPGGNGSARIQQDLIQVEVVIFKITDDSRLLAAVDEDRCHRHVASVFCPYPAHGFEFADARAAGRGCDDHDVDLRRDDVREGILFSVFVLYQGEVRTLLFLGVDADR